MAEFDLRRFQLLSFLSLFNYPVTLIISLSKLTSASFGTFITLLGFSLMLICVFILAFKVVIILVQNPLEVKCVSILTSASLQIFSPKTNLVLLRFIWLLFLNLCVILHVNQQLFRRSLLLVYLLDII